MGTEFQLGKKNSSGDEWWRRLYNNVIVPSDTDLYT